VVDSSASYTVATTPTNSLNFGTFTASKDPLTGKACELDITFEYADGTTVSPTAFTFPLSTTASTSVGVVYQPDNTNVKIHNLVLKAAIKYGTAKSQMAATYEIKGNPCLTASVSVAAAPNPVIATLVVVKSPFK